jgi:nucleotide-binding universal stress UspA family protein
LPVPQTLPYVLATSWKEGGGVKYGVVVVGTDGSDSAGAVDRAVEVAGNSKALLIVVCAFSALSRREHAVATAQVGDTRFQEVIGRDAADSALAAAQQRADAGGAPRVETRLVEGDPVHVLLEVADERAADLIVVGNRGINTASGASSGRFRRWSRNGRRATS